MTAQQTITINVLINYLNNARQLLESVSEFNFAIPLADKVKRRGCQCGLGGEFAEVSQTFNEVVQNLSPETIQKLKDNFNTTSICFGVQNKYNYSLKCY